MKWSKVEEEEGGRYMREDEGPACGCHCHLCPLRLWRWTVTHRVRALVAVSPPHTWVFPHPRDTGVTVCLSPASLVSPGVQRWLDVLVGRVCSLHQAHLATAQELAAAQEHGEGLRQQQEQLEERQAALEGLWQQKQEELRGARLRREEVEAKGQRCRGLCLGCQQDLERMEQELERLRRLRRGYRQDFGQQLDAIMEEHKHLQEAHAPAQLEAELVQLEEAREKLLRQGPGSAPKGLALPCKGLGPLLGGDRPCSLRAPSAGDREAAGTRGACGHATGAAGAGEGAAAAGGGAGAAAAGPWSQGQAGRGAGEAAAPPGGID
ncbi:uncharacterized protein LOC114011450 isoform X1 [Falco peregrinus]|uniref:uncharacterized protein LOC114011450 isoform X1 n=1 Tax=Falco peregrinus TaxID=8954 RepID=UPI00247ACFEC|nr:uncharacterized protein LOC114011450 isoform X1 [Falco peregrinus]